VQGLRQTNRKEQIALTLTRISKRSGQSCRDKLASLSHSLRNAAFSCRSPKLSRIRSARAKFFQLWTTQDSRKRKRRCRPQGLESRQEQPPSRFVFPFKTITMSRYKGGQSAKAVEKDFPHFVDMFVPDGGLGRRLDTMYEWHRTSGIESHHVRGRRSDEGRYYVRWCFDDAALARAFADKFGT